MERYLSRCSLILLFAWFTSLPVHAAEYCLRPSKEDGTQADSVVCCTTPAGWQGWKDDLKHLTSTQRLLKDQVTRAFFRASVSFFPSNCVAEDKFGMKNPKCASLRLTTRVRDSHGRPDIETGLRDFVEELEQPQDLSARKPPCVVVSRFGSFQTKDSGDLTIWQIGCPSGRQELVTLFAQRDVLVIIELGGPDMKDIVPKVDSLKELARSVRIVDASLALPDIVEIKIDRLSNQTYPRRAIMLSDAVIKQQLLRLARVGTSIEKVYDVLQSHLFYKEVHRSKGGLWVEIGSYSKPVPQPTATKSWPPSEEEIRSQISAPVILPPKTIVRAFWKFDRQRKLRDIEIKREVVEFKPKQ